MSNRPSYHVGHLNVAVLVDDPESETVAEFMNAIDTVNGIAERSPGFVANINGDEFDRQFQASNHPLTTTPRLIATLSVWESAEALDQFVYKTLHATFFKRRKAWFEKMETSNYVVWPIEAGHRPTLEEALERLSLLGENGPSSEAFDLAWHRKHAGQQEAAHV